MSGLLATMRSYDAAACRRSAAVSCFLAAVNRIARRCTRLLLAALNLVLAASVVVAAGVPALLFFAFTIGRLVQPACQPPEACY